MLKTKICTICKIEKPRERFYLLNKNKKYIASRCIECDKKYSLEKYKVKDLRIAIIDRLGRKCVKCGFSDIRALQIDHKEGGGKKEINSFKGNYRNYYRMILGTNLERFQILCANCNWIKRYENNECKNDR